MNSWAKREADRLALQSRLDDGKTPEDRRRMGQFATPTNLAQEILAHGVNLLPKDEKVRFLDPTIGTGAFYSALLASDARERIESAMGFEIDSHYGRPAGQFWRTTPLRVRVGDFTTAVPARSEMSNLIICNPPYVRHHFLDRNTKIRLQGRTEAVSGVRLSGLAGLYCYFMVLAHAWMADNGIAGWLVPSEFMDVNYGRQLKRYLLERVTLLRIHRFDPEDSQFSDALVSSAVVWFRKAAAPRAHQIRFSYGGTLAAPAASRSVPLGALAQDAKWTRYPLADSRSATKPNHAVLGDLFDIKRGVATGGNRFFIMTRDQMQERGLPRECFTPVLPSARHLKHAEIKSDSEGVPLLEKPLFLLTTRLPEEEIAMRYPALGAYLESGRRGATAVAHGYLCRSRTPWYSQERRPAAPFVCTYMGRATANTKPFRFFLNHSRATACNVYLMLYPRPALETALKRRPSLRRDVWEFLDSIPTAELIGNGRVYGGGLHKLEPKELRRVGADRLEHFI